MKTLHPDQALQKDTGIVNSIKIHRHLRVKVSTGATAETKGEKRTNGRKHPFPAILPLISPVCSTAKKELVPRRMLPSSGAYSIISTESRQAVRCKGMSLPFFAN